MCIIDTKSYDPDNKDVAFEKKKTLSSASMINSSGGAHQAILTVRMKQNADGAPEI